MTLVAAGSAKNSNIPHGHKPITLPLKISAPLSQTRAQAIYNDGSFFLEDVTNNSEQWNHTINAVGGFDTASFVIKGTEEYLLDWFQNGLFRTVIKENPEGNSIWEGFINRMSLSYGRKIKVKSLDNVYSRILIKFSPSTFTTDANGNILVISNPAQTFFFEDNEAITDYGYKESSINGGERVIQTAINWGNSIIDDVAKRIWEIEPTISDNPFSGNELSIQVECLGWHHLLKWLHYTITTGGTISKTALLKQCIEVYNTHNTDYFSEDYTFIDDNSQLTKQGYNDNPNIHELIFGGNGIVNTGGPYFYRWVGGVYESRIFKYNQAKNKTLRNLYSSCDFMETDIKDVSQKIYSGCTGAEIKPWDLRPDSILVTRDSTLGGEDESYITSVNFQEPYQYNLISEDSNKLSILLKQKGLPGFS